MYLKKKHRKKKYFPELHHPKSNTLLTLFQFIFHSNNLYCIYNLHFVFKFNVIFKVLPMVYIGNIELKHWVKLFYTYF